MAFKDVKVTSVFRQNFDTRAKVVVNRGGARSSKSYSLAQLFIHRLTNEKSKKILIVRKTYKSCMETCKKLVLGLLREYDLMRFCEVRDLGDLYYKPTDSFIRFTGSLDVGKLKSTEWNYIWMEEGNEFTYYDFDILKLRLSAPTTDGQRNQIFLSLNPESAFHWIKVDLLDTDSDTVDIASSFLNNSFLDDDYINSVILPLRKYPSKWKVFGLGLWGVLEDIIYSNWNTIQAEDWPEEFDETVYGMDFGFNVESGLIEINFKDGVIYERELLYETGLTNTKLIEKVKTLIPKKQRKCYLFAETEPDRIEEFCIAGFNCHPADKSVKDGINYVMDKEIKIHADSVNLIKEKRGYSWKTDKEGNALDEPIKWRDHLMDPERYGLYSHFKMLGEGRPSFRVV